MDINGLTHLYPLSILPNLIPPKSPILTPLILGSKNGSSKCAKLLMTLKMFSMNLYFALLATDIMDSSLPARHQVASEIQSIKSRIKNISELRRRYQDEFGIDHRVTGSSTMNDSRRYSRDDALLVEEAKLVGIDQPKQHLISKLLERHDHQLKVISVVGMAGLGKTTLVKKVHEDPEVRKNFPVRAWVTVSQTCDFPKLLRDLIRQLNKDLDKSVPQSIESMTTAELKEFVKDFLRRAGRYAIVRRLALHSSSNSSNIQYHQQRQFYSFEHLRSFITVSSTDPLLSKTFLSEVLRSSKLLKVLELGGQEIGETPNEIFNLLHLTYLSLYGTKLDRVPRAIGKLQHLEYLNLGDTGVRELPVEILKLQKLRHLIVFQPVDPSDDDYGVHGFKGPSKLGGLLALQRLNTIDVSSGSVIVKEIGKLTQLREAEEDPLESLQHLFNLDEICFCGSYQGERLCFKAGGFLKLKQLSLRRMEGLRWMTVEEGACPNLQKLVLDQLPSLEDLPSGIQHLSHLQELHLYEMSSRLIEKVENQKEDSEDYRRMAHIPEIVIGFYADDGEWRIRRLWGKKKKTFLA
ncbi:unnamed protein product [Coffea canephora]|uniref:Uncharacterized protein n=1 Tax=Coffea canephora TaxID=49390 RepID=A0A068UWY7_COFCA|nr:unnamed protein product [Coffea canephora]